MNILDPKELDVICIENANHILRMLGYYKFAANIHSGKSLPYKTLIECENFNAVGITWIRNNIYSIILYKIEGSYTMEYYVLSKVYHNMEDDILQLEECPDYLV